LSKAAAAAGRIYVFLRIHKSTFTSDTIAEYRMTKLKDRVHQIKSMGEKISLWHLIEELEQINEEHLEESERRVMVEEAVDACKKSIKDHIQTFIMENPDAKYEEWIRELHPDNAEYADAEIIDHRFYAEDSDHRHIWNEHVEQLDGCEYKRVKPKQVHPRYDRKRP
jgi:hypothetical protein